MWRFALRVEATTEWKNHTQNSRWEEQIGVLEEPLIQCGQPEAHRECDKSERSALVGMWRSFCKCGSVLKS